MLATVSAEREDVGGTTNIFCAELDYVGETVHSFPLPCSENVLHGALDRR